MRGRPVEMKKQRPYVWRLSSVWSERAKVGVGRARGSKVRLAPPALLLPQRKLARLAGPQGTCRNDRISFGNEMQAAGQLPSTSSLPRYLPLVIKSNSIESQANKEEGCGPRILLLDRAMELSLERSPLKGRPLPLDCRPAAPISRENASVERETKRDEDEALDRLTREQLKMERGRGRYALLRRAPDAKVEDALPAHRSCEGYCLVPGERSGRTSNGPGCSDGQWAWNGLGPAAEEGASYSVPQPRRLADSKGRSASAPPRTSSSADQERRR